MVARLDNEPYARGGRARARGAREPRAPRRRGRRRAHRRRRGHPRPAPAPLLPRRRGLRAAASPAATASASASCRTTRRTASRSSSSSSATSAPRARSSSAGATCRSTRRTSATARTPAARTSARSSSRPGPAHRDDQDAFERKLYVIRRIVELAAGPDFYSPSFSSRTCVYKGMLISHQLRGFYPDLRDERFGERHGARALALLDEHVPELGARPSLPDDLPQRRDQHADGQRQLDARARVAARSPTCSAATCRRSCRSCAPAARTRRRSTTCSSCSCSPAGRRRTR